MLRWVLQVEGIYIREKLGTLAMKEGWNKS